jgi:hypothetical protein
MFFNYRFERNNSGKNLQASGEFKYAEVNWANELTRHILIVTFRVCANSQKSSAILNPESAF